MTCGLRGFTLEASRSLDLYGDIHRFIPLLAVARGFQVEEIPVRQREEDAQLRMFGPGVYFRRLLDVLHVFFLTKFARKPLRFFGLIGLVTAAAGFLITAGLSVQRLFGQTALADRPLLLLGVLLLALGIQIVSIGLIGEIVIFFGARERETPSVELEPEAEVGVKREPSRSPR
jgi:dolichol-phosphate mannosyltransferase